MQIVEDNDGQKLAVRYITRSDMKEKELIRKVMTMLGGRTSERKKISSRKNGKLGGRPRKKNEQSL